ncbi:hypothetical protein [Emticicia soli]|uniref:Outer membrane protein beta-barrel domain-containing protein n=1 Tax=Emticicia soli TaxID=2027878 RepID=A0ABW5J6K1_9BACT
MKKTAYLILCLISFNAYSQFEKGKYFVGVDYSQNFLLPERKNSRISTSPIFGVPTGGYFLKENMLLGLNIAFQLPPKDFRALINKPYILASLSPFFRLYKKTSNKIVPFIQLSPKIGTRIGTTKIVFDGIAEDIDGTLKYKENMFGAQINAGASFKLSQKVLFDLSLYLDRVSITQSMALTGSLTNPNPKSHYSYSNTGITGGLKILL